MCVKYKVVKKQFPKENQFAPKFAGIINDPNYNAAPSQQLPVITNEQPDKIQLFQ